MSKAKMALWAFVVVALVLGGGWLWGASGRWAAEAQTKEATLQWRLSEGRAELTAARVNVFELNFGDASRHIEQAKQALTAAAGLLDQRGAGDAAKDVRQVVAKASDAQQLTGRVDQTANARLGEALKRLDAIALPK
jgi:hypothetical protein